MAYESSAAAQLGFCFANDVGFGGQYHDGSFSEWGVVSAQRRASWLGRARVDAGSPATVTAQSIFASDGTTTYTVSTQLNSMLYGSSGGYIVFAEDGKLYGVECRGGTAAVIRRGACPGRTDRQDCLLLERYFSVCSYAQLS